MNRSSKHLLLFVCVAVLAVLLVYAARSKQSGSSTRNVPIASQPGPDLPARRFHIINLSMARTGTASIAGLFGHFRSGHEYLLPETLTHILDRRDGLISDAELDAFLLERDRRSGLEIDSTSVLYLAQDRLFALFPDARFLLVVRNGADRLVSLMEMMNFLQQSCAKEAMFYGMPCAELMRQAKRAMPPSLARSMSPALTDVKSVYMKSLPDLAADWGKWTLTTLQNLGRLPPGRVLIIRTNDIDASYEQLAALAGIDQSELDLSKHHLNRAREKLDISDDERAAITAAFQPWQAKVDARLSELGVR
jgi:hypothetical protein